MKEIELLEKIVDLQSQRIDALNQRIDLLADLVSKLTGDVNDFLSFHGDTIRAIEGYLGDGYQEWCAEQLQMETGETGEK